MAIPVPRTRRSGKTLRLSGAPGVGADGHLAEGIAAQSRHCFAKTSATLAGEGPTLAGVVARPCSRADPADFAAVIAVPAEMFPEPDPAPTAIG